MTQPDPSSTHPTDGQLLAAYAAGQGQTAFAEIVRRHGPLVLGVCRSVLHNQAEAEDAAQAVFLTLARKAHSLRRQTTLGGWLYRVAWYIAQRAAAAAAVRRRHEQEAARMKDPAVHDPPPAEPSPALYAALAQLPEKYRVPLILHHLQGRTEAEVAALLKLKPSAASVRLARGRQLLRTRLAQAPAALAAPESVAAAPAPGAAATLPMLALPALSAAFLTQTAPTAQAALTGAALPAPALALSQGALRMLLFTQLKSAAIITLATLIFFAGLSGAYLALAAPPQTAPAYTAAPSTPPAHPTPWVELRGRILGPNDQPVADLSVYVIISIPHTLSITTVRELKTDAAGNFSLRVHPRAEVRLYGLGPCPGLFPVAIDNTVPNWIGSPALKTAGPAPAPVIIRLGPGTAHFAGRVLDSAGKPVAGARVKLLPQGEIPGRPDPLAMFIRNQAFDEEWANFSATSAADGRWQVTLPPLICTVYEVKPPEKSKLDKLPTWAYPLSMTATAGQTTTFPDLILPPPPDEPPAPKRVRPAPPAPAAPPPPEWRTIHGQITGPDGKGIPNIALQAIPVLILTDPAADIITARTDADGRYTIPNLPTGRNVLLVGLPDDFPFVVANSHWPIASEAWSNTEITPAVLNGQPLDFQLIPAIIAQIKVSGPITTGGLASCAVGAKYGKGTISHQMTIQTQGLHALGATSQPSEYSGQVLLRIPQYFPIDAKQPITALTVALGPLPGGLLPEPSTFTLDLKKTTLQSFTAKLVPGLSLTGQILDSNKQPVPDALVHASLVPVDVAPGVRTAGTPHYARSDAQGRYHIDHLTPGKYALDASVDDDRNLCLEDPTHVTLQEGKPPADTNFRMVPGATITGRLMDRKEPVPAMVFLQPQDPGETLPHVYVLQHATEYQPFRLWRLPAGDYQLVADERTSDGHPVPLPPRTAPTAPATAKITLDSGQKLEKDLQIPKR